MSAPKSDLDAEFEAAMANAEPADANVDAELAAAMQQPKKEFVPPQTDFPAPISQAESGARGLFNGLTMGFGDNIEAGLAALTGDNYKRKLAQIRARNMMAQVENPGTHAVANMVGGGVSSAAIPGGLATKLGASTGLAALGESDDATDPGNLVMAAGSGALGAGVGKAAGTIAKGLSQLVRYEAQPGLVATGHGAMQDLDLGVSKMVAKPSSYANAASWATSDVAVPAAAYAKLGPVGGMLAQAAQSPIYRGVQQGLMRVGQAGQALGSKQGVAAQAGAAGAMRDMAVQMARQKVQMRGGGLPSAAEHQKLMQTDPAYREAENERANEKK